MCTLYSSSMILLISALCSGVSRLKIWKPSSMPDWKARNSTTRTKASIELSAQKWPPSRSRFNILSIIVIVPRAMTLGNHLLVKKVPSIVYALRKQVVRAIA